MTTKTKTTLPETGLYWDGEGRYKAAAAALRALIPMCGEVDQPKKNRKLEKYRKAVNCYHDLYNNGLWNRASEFRAVFGMSAAPYRRGRGWSADIDFDAIAPVLEPIMDAIIVAAAREQGFGKLIDIIDNATAG